MIRRTLTGLRRRFRPSLEERAEALAAKTAQQEARMSLLEHLDDLRMTILRMALAVAIFSGVALIFAEDVLLFLLSPYGDLLQVTGPTESVSIWIRVGLTTGIAAASPFIIWEILKFVRPGLKPTERRPIFMVVPGAIFLFVTGAAFAWFVMMPAAIGFLSAFMPDIFRVEWKANEYIPFVLQLTLWIGIAFEMPLVAMALAWIGVITPKQLAQGWRIAIVAIAVIAAMITPTVDPFNMALVMGPLAGLYVLSIVLSWFPYRARMRRKKAQEQEAEAA